MWHVKLLVRILVFTNSQVHDKIIIIEFRFCMIARIINALVCVIRLSFWFRQISQNPGKSKRLFFAL